MEFIPPLIRNCIFHAIFDRYGTKSFIDYKTYFRYPRKMRIGNSVSINQGCRFYPSQLVKETYIEIGNHVVISPYVTFFSAEHDYTSLDLPDIARSIIVEDYVWIGGNSVILPGVKIGKGSIIGAGSVVVKDIPPWSVAVGNPAKIIYKRNIEHILDNL